MALLEKIDLPDGWIVLWLPEEPEGFYRTPLRLTPQEEEFLRTLRQPRRRKEWLAWRFLLQRELGKNAGAGYAESGAPVLRGATGHIGVAHSEGIVGLRYSCSPCGIDIEPIHRNFEKAESRFLSPSEKNTLTDSGIPHPVCTAWCAKEAAYKFAGKTGVDFLKDLVILSASEENGLLEVRIGQTLPVRVKIRFTGPYCLAYTL